MKKLIFICLIIFAVVMVLASCGNNNTHTHEHGEWSTTQNPTCTEGGVKVRYCSCGEKQSENILAIGHTEVVDAAVDATCTETGLTEGKHCSVCGETIVAQVSVEAKGHSFENRVCPICGEKDYSEGLEFTSNGDGTCYVSEIGTCTDTYIIIPPISPAGDYVVGIGSSAFSSCSSLTSVEMPDSVTSIGGYAFDSCSSLTSIEISNSVTEIGYSAFSGCSSLTSIEIPDSVTRIGNWAFAYCSLLTSIVIPDGVPSIGDWAFFNCGSLTSIVIPDSVTSIGYSAFYDCTSLTDVYYTGSESEWATIYIDDYGNEYLINATIHYNYVPEN